MHGKYLTIIKTETENGLASDQGTIVISEAIKNDGTKLMNFGGSYSIEETTKILTAALLNLKAISAVKEPVLEKDNDDIELK